MDKIVEAMALAIAPMICRPVHNGDVDDVAAGQDFARRVAKAALAVAGPMVLESQGLSLVEIARFKVCSAIAHDQAATYLIPGYLRGELDDSVAIQTAIRNLKEQFNGNG